MELMRHCTLIIVIAAPLLAQVGGTLRGVVKDAISGEPLPSFSVSTPGKSTAITDQQGRYVLRFLTPGTLVVTARSTQRQAVSRQVELHQAEELTLDFTIPPNSTVAGRVIDSDNRPVEGISIWVVQGSAAHSLMGPQVTDKDGQYRFSFGLDPGPQYYLLANRPVDPADKRERIPAPTYYGNVIDFESATPIVLQPREQREGIDIKMQTAPHYCIDGKIDVAGRPSKMAFGIYEQALSATQLARATTASSDDGTFRVCHLTRGQYRLVSADPQRYGGSVDFSISNSDVHHIYLGIDLVPLHLEMIWEGTPPPKNQLPEPGAQPVRITTSGGHVAVMPQGGDFNQLMELNRLLGAANPVNVRLEGVSNRAGFQRMERAPYDGPFGRDIPVGDYRVTVSPPPGCCYLKSISYGGLALEHGILHLAPGTSGTLRLVFSNEGGRAKFGVTDRDANSVSTVILLVPATVSEAAQLPSVSKILPWSMPSTFLPPGKYHALALPRSPDWTADQEKIWSLLSAATQIEIARNATLEVNLLLSRIE